jgi:hypothetical protein
LDGSEYLILACSDGAGSERQSQIGSKVAAEQAIRLAGGYLRSGNPLPLATPELIRSWVTGVREELGREAAQRSLAPRELACTLALGVLGPASSAFLQIGDGAIVILQAGLYRPVFWPQNGEYQNETYFVTDHDAEEKAVIEVVPRAVDEAALITDGLQMLALNYVERTAHQPFFAPMFKALRDAGSEAELVDPLHNFLESAAVNARTDDDKTLILAARVSPCGNDAL